MSDFLNLWWHLIVLRGSLWQLVHKEPIDLGHPAACWEHFSNLLLAVTGVVVISVLTCFWCHCWAGGFICWSENKRTCRYNWRHRKLPTRVTSQSFFITKRGKHFYIVLGVFFCFFLMAQTSFRLNVEV